MSRIKKTRIEGGYTLFVALRTQVFTGKMDTQIFTCTYKDIHFTVSRLSKNDTVYLVQDDGTKVEVLYLSNSYDWGLSEEEMDNLVYHPIKAALRKIKIDKLLQ